MSSLDVHTILEPENEQLRVTELITLYKNQTNVN